jgi:hypothetical protein
MNEGSSASVSCTMEEDDRAILRAQEPDGGGAAVGGDHPRPRIGDLAERDVNGPGRPVVYMTRGLSDRADRDRDPALRRGRFHFRSDDLRAALARHDRIARHPERARFGHGLPVPKGLQRALWGFSGLLFARRSAIPRN